MKRLAHTYKINLLFGVIILFMIAGVILLNAVAVQLDNRFHLQVDLTSGGVFEVGEQTRSFLETLAQPVEIFVLANPGDFSGSPYLVQALHILNEYPRFSELVTLQYVDFTANPLFAASFPDLSLSHGDILVRSGENVEQIFSANLFHIGRLPDGNLTVLASRVEEALTSAILSAVSDERVSVALLTGNGAQEAPAFAALLANNHYRIETVGMSGAVFDDFDLLLLFAPTIDLSEDVVRRLDAFLYNGGQYGKTLFYTASPAQGDLPNLDAFLREWGIAFHPGMVFETNPEHTYQFQPFFPTAGYMDTRYAGLLRDSSMPFLMPQARPIELLFTARDGRLVETLLAFAPSSGVQPPDADENFTAGDATLRGPFPALASASFHATGPEGEQLQSQILVSASTGIFEPIALANTSLTNAEYLLNLLGDLLGRTHSVNIEPVSLAGATLGITSAQAARLGVVLVGVIPLGILLAGLATWLVRRHK